MSPATIGRPIGVWDGTDRCDGGNESSPPPWSMVYGYYKGQINKEDSGPYKEPHLSRSTDDHDWNGVAGEGNGVRSKGGNPFRVALNTVGMGGLRPIEVTSLCGDQHWYAHVICA
jgi:hypothetical protein